MSLQAEVRWYDASGVEQPLPPAFVGDWDFSLVAQGGCESFSLTVPAEYEDATLAALLDSLPAVGWRVEFWLDGMCAFRGWADRVEPAISAGQPALKLTGSGLMARLSKLRAYLTYIEPQGGDIHEVFEKLSARYLVGAHRLDEASLGGWAQDLQTIGHSLKRIEFWDTSLLDAFNQLSDAADQILWGFRVKSTGENELYAHPLPTTVLRDDFVVTVGRDVLYLAEPDDLDWVVNHLKLRGGPSKNPNLVTNGSFEQLLLPGETEATNLLLNPSFEEGGGQESIWYWNRGGSALRRPTNRDLGEHARSGDYFAELDNSGDWISQTRPVPVSPTGTTPFLLTTHYAVEAVDWGTVQILVETVSGGQVTGTALWAMQPTDSQSYDQRQDTFSVGSDVSALRVSYFFPEAADRDLNAPPGNPAVWARYVVGPAPTGAWSGHAKELAIWDGVAWRFAQPVLNAQVRVADEGVWLQWNGADWVAGPPCKPIMLDDIWLDRADRPAAEGWKIQLGSSADRCDALWGLEAGEDGSSPPYHGNAYARLVCTTSPGFNAALLPADDRWCPARPGTTYELSVWMRTQASQDYQLQIAWYDLKMRIQRIQSPWLKTLGDGEWHRYSFSGRIGQHMMGTMRPGLLMQTGTYDIDAMMLREARASMASETDFYEGDQLEWRFNTNNDAPCVAIEGWSAEAQASIGLYGVREEVVEHEEITTLNHAKRYAKAWLERRCKPRRHGRLILSGERIPNPTYFIADGQPSGRVRIEGLETPLTQFPARVVVSSGEDGLRVEMDLEERRPDPALVLLEYLERRQRAGRRGQYAGGRGSLVGSAGEAEASPMQTWIYGPDEPAPYTRVWDALSEATTEDPALFRTGGSVYTVTIYDAAGNATEPESVLLVLLDTGKPLVEGMHYTREGAVLTFAAGARPLPGERVLVVGRL